MNDRQAVALGEGEADVVIQGGRTYVSGRGAFLDRDVAIVDDRIAALREDVSDVVGDETTVIDAAGRDVLPGLIDAHTHAEVLLTVERAIPHLLAAGTTSLVSETSGLGTLFGARGVETLLAVTEDLPCSVYFTVPPQLLVDTFEPIRASDAEVDALAACLEHERIVGVGEVDWIHVVGRDSPLETLVSRAAELDKRVVGHGAGCRGRQLAAFATVVDDDHEAILAEGVQARANEGLHVTGRCGSVRDDLPAFVDALDRIDPANVSLSTDGVWPPELVDGFGMADVVRRTIELGIDPPLAIDMATRNPATHYRLGPRGVLALGALADVLVVDAVETMGVETVVVDGDVVVADGEPIDVSPAETIEYPEFVRDSVTVALENRRFTAPASAARDGRVRALHVESGLVTTETTVEPAVDGDVLVADSDADILTATLLDRDPSIPDRGFTGFLEGFGLDAGAIATTNTWEVPGLAVIATDSHDARVAAARVIHVEGGWAFAREGEIVAEVPMPIGGVASAAPAEVVARDLNALETALRNHGVTVDRPLLSIQTLSFPGVPELKLSFSGYADVRGRRLVGLDPAGQENGFGHETD